jgi:xanthosine utilization system XapX-like protein
MALICAVLSLGRLDWWFEAPWIGWSLALAVVLIVSAIVFEHNRSNPLLNTRWLSSGSIVRLGLIMLLIRIVLAEQNTGVFGWLQYVGLQNEQMTNLAWSILAGIICGIIASCLTIKPQRLSWPIVTSLVLMIIASLMDSQSTSLTRPDQLMISQFLLGFGSAFFLAPAMLAGIGGVVADPRNLVSFSVLFGMSQNIGGLLGSAILGTFQTWREKYHSSLLADQLTTLNPLVNERLQLYSQMYQSMIGDSTLLSVQAATQLQNVSTLEANILAYNDTYLLTASVAAATLVWIFWRLLRLRITARIVLRQATGTKNKSVNFTGVSMSQQDAAKERANTRSNLRVVSIFAAAAIGIVGVLVILYAWQLPPFTRQTQFTDNAYVRGLTTFISPQVNGYITQVNVQDFARVKKATC